MLRLPGRSVTGECVDQPQDAAGKQQVPDQLQFGVGWPDPEQGEAAAVVKPDRTRAKQRVRSVQQRLKPDDGHAEGAIDHTAEQHRRPGSSMPAACFDGPPDKLRHAGPQRKDHRKPLTEQAK
jgi:hypothetical protein